ncbi:6-aminohexanoate-dimer hydrolase [Lignipirellula cremea]|uniref:6-aminohexanoate-dimer hydrolase n=2 Tax=Lignipirellula cremea TaxID=2528010 RepID=A0A518DXI0_9BACT|nr:6-aminohexanoate-dimer hydrolase [Lignipirellula cremea]
MGLTLFVLGSGLVLPASGQVGDQSSNKETLAKSPLRWDDLKANRDPQPHLFAGDYPAGMLRRPEQLTADTWFHDGHLRTYALLNLSDVVRTVEISRGKGPVFMFGNARVPALLDEVSITFEHKEFPRSGQPIPLRELTSWVNCQGILVVRRGKVVFEEYPGMDPSQRHHWMSVSKTTLNMLMGKLVGEGKFDLSKTVEDYIPEMKGKGYGSFTIQELADMDADVSMDERNYHDPKSEFWSFGRSMGWFNDDGKWPGGNKQFLPTLNRLKKPEGEDGQSVRYTSSNSQVIAWVIENVTRKPMTEYFETSVWRHIGAVSNASVTVDRHGFPFVGGGYSSTLRDLARYGIIWANKGVAPDGARIFPEVWMKENTTGKGPKLRDYRYHNQSYSKGGAIAHQGHSGQMLWVNPASGTVVVTFGSTTTPSGGNAWSRQAYLAVAETIDQHLQDRKIASSPR